MSRILYLVLAFVALLVSPSVWAQDAGGQYRLHPGDTVSISVWHEDTLQKEVVVLPDGSVTFPLAGRVEVQGLTTPEAAKRVADKLKEYIPDPVVTVVVTKADGSLVYVVGKVLKPGPVPLTGPLTVLQALGMAGGLDKFADSDDIQVLRPTGKGTTVLLPVHYGDLLKGRDLKSNVALQAGDTILVP